MNKLQSKIHYWTFCLFVSISIILSACQTEDQENKAENEETQSDSLSIEEMSATKDKAKQVFNEAKYGMFIHWGVYAIPGGIWKGVRMEDKRGPKIAEWIMLGSKIPRAEYAKLAEEFNPTDFDADAIATLAKNAGMKYIVITSKHHDGFALYDSEVSEFDIMDASPYKKDIIKALYDACKKQGLDFGLYYSHNIDWMDGNDCGYADFIEADMPLTRHAKKKMGVNDWDPSPNTFKEYLDNKAYPQVKEILTKFPDLNVLWYDMGHYLSPKQGYKFYKIAYDLQPNLLVNSRVIVGSNIGDFIIPGDNKIPQDYKTYEKPWQAIGTTNNSWGYKSYDDDWKTTEELLFWLVEIVSKGGSYMLNIGPDGLGRVPEESVRNLTEVGNWLKVNGEAIYGTQMWEIDHEGPTKIVINSTEARAKMKDKEFKFTPEDFWFTQKAGNVYVMALAYPKDKILIKSLSTENAEEVKKVELLGSEEELPWSQTSEGLEVNLGNIKGNEKGYALKIGF